MYWNCLELTYDSHPDRWHLVILAFESLESPAINHEHPTLSSDHLGSLYTITVIHVIPMMYHDVSIYHTLLYSYCISIYFYVSIIYISIYSYYTRKICIIKCLVFLIFRIFRVQDLPRTSGELVAAALSARRQAGHGGALASVHCNGMPRFVVHKKEKHGKSWKIDWISVNLCESLECMRSVISKD